MNGLGPEPVITTTKVLKLVGLPVQAKINHE